MNPGLLHHASVAEKKAKQGCIRKANAKSAFMHMLQRLDFRGVKLVYADGSSKWHDMHDMGYIGGFGVFVDNELSLSLYNPPPPPPLSNHLVWYRTGLRCSAASKTLNNVVMTMRL